MDRMKRAFAVLAAALIAGASLGIPAQAAASMVVAPSGQRIAAAADRSAVFALKGNPRLRPATTTKSTSASLLAGPPYFLYNVGSQAYNLEGSRATVLAGCSASSLNTATDYHTLGEITVENGNNIIELGYTCDPAVNGGSGAPHFFTGYWVNGVFQGYNGGSGFSRVAGACDLIGTAATTGTAYSMLIQRYNGAWWFGIDSCWVGYVVDSAWSGAFTQGTFVQYFHEIASTETKPCSDMGNGYPGTSPTPNEGARFSSISFLRANGNPAYPTTDIDLFVRPVPTVEAGSPYYVVNKLSGRSFRSGGPGWNAAGTAVGTRLVC